MFYVIAGIKTSGRGSSRGRVISFWTGSGFGAKPFAKKLDTYEKACKEKGKLNFGHINGYEAVQIVTTD